MNFVVLSSSQGTTFQAIIDRMHDGSLTAKCLGLVTDRSDRGCIEKAKKADIPVAIVGRKENESREEYDERLHQTILSLTTNNQKPLTNNLLLAAIGWMYILSPWFIKQWKNRILNVHPALLPKYGGKGMLGMKVHSALIEAKEKQTGMTIHLMDEGVDTGAIIVQKMCSIEPTDTPDMLKKKVQDLEKEWYPKTLQMIEQGEIRLPE